MQEEKAPAMLLSGVPSPAATTYFADVENAGEMARLLKQARFATKGLGGLFPHHLDISDVHGVLDLACGPGEWALAVAEAYPAICVTGVAGYEELIPLYNRMLEEMRADDFCSLSFALQVWGYKPQNNHRSALEQVSQGTPEPARSQGSGL